LRVAMTTLSLGHFRGKEGFAFSNMRILRKICTMKKEAHHAKQKRMEYKVTIQSITLIVFNPLSAVAGCRMSAGSHYPNNNYD